MPRRWSPPPLAQTSTQQESRPAQILIYVLHVKQTRDLLPEQGASSSQEWSLSLEKGKQSVECPSYYMIGCHGPLECATAKTKTMASEMASEASATPIPLFFHHHIKSDDEGLYQKIKGLCEAALPGAGWLPSDGAPMGTFILRSVNHFCLEQVTTWLLHRTVAFTVAPHCSRCRRLKPQLRCC